MSPPAVSLETHRDGILAGGVGRNETPPAFLIQRVGGFSLLTPLQVISVHAPNNRSNGPTYNSNR